MSNINLSKQLEKLEQQLEAGGTTPTLLLHCCCAPCSSSVLERLTSHFSVTVFFFNPNIYPEGEYHHRLTELKRLIAEQPYSNPVNIIEAEYDPRVFFNVAKGLEDCPERGERCKICYRLRLERTAREAKSRGFDYFTTTLSVSPLKDAQVLYEICRGLSDEYGVATIPADFKKKDGFKRSIELSSQYALYRQNFCGCVFSRDTGTK